MVKMVANIENTRQDCRHDCFRTNHSFLTPQGVEVLEDTQHRPIALYTLSIWELTEDTSPEPEVLHLVALCLEPLPHFTCFICSCCVRMSWP